MTESPVICSDPDPGGGIPVFVGYSWQALIVTDYIEGGHSLRRIFLTTFRGGSPEIIVTSAESVVTAVGDVRSIRLAKASD